MIPLIINKKPYDCPESWKDIPLSKLGDLSRLCEELPETTRSIFIVSGDKPAVTSCDDGSELFDFKQRVVALLCGIPINISKKISKTDILHLFDNALVMYVVSVIDRFVGYEYSGAEYFDWKGERYYFPTSDTDILGEAMPLAGLEAIQFAQLSDLALLGDKMKDGNCKLCATMVAIACLKHDEVYSSEIATMRTGLFLEIPMFVVLDVFFCLQQLTTISVLSTQIATAQEKLE